MARRKLLIPGLLLVLGSTTGAQTRDANVATKTNTRNAKTEKDLEAERILKARRANAQSLLINLAADARNFKDNTLRARTQARIASALWESDRERSRTIFRSAWDAAELADKESQERMQEEIRQQQAKTGGGGYVLASPPDLRREVLGLAAKRDRALGEEFLAKFKAQKEREVSETKSKGSNLFSSGEAAAQRLGLAEQLLEAGDIERALQFADPVLGEINVQSIDFLASLRDKDAVAADSRYAAMLANAGANPQSDANTVSLLSSYIFTPRLYITFHGSGASSSQMSSRTGAVEVSADLRAAFFRTAAGILLRPLAPPGQDQSSLGIDGQYLVMKRLLPLFEQFAPQETTTAIKAQLEALTALASNNARDRDDEWTQRGLSPEKPVADREQSLLDQIDRAKTSAERDQLNLQLAMLLAGKGDVRARDFVSKIDDTETRNSARAYIDASMAMQAINKKDTERALEIAKVGELTHLQRAWLLAQTAKLLAKTDRDKALALIDDAATEARRMEGADPDRPRALLAVANVLFALDRGSTWQMIGEAIKAANGSENFSGEDGELTFRMITKGSRSITQNTAPEFDVAGMFEALAGEDYDKAVESAQGFEHEAPRANALIAIARAILEEKKK